MSTVGGSLRRYRAAHTKKCPALGSKAGQCPYPLGNEMPCSRFLIRRRSGMVPPFCLSIIQRFEAVAFCPCTLETFS